MHCTTIKWSISILSVHKSHELRSFAIFHTGIVPPDRMSKILLDYNFPKLKLSIRERLNLMDENEFIFFENRI
ncbi:hypothetical protein D3C81_988130 [compost metagenome]